MILESHDMSPKIKATRSKRKIAISNQLIAPMMTSVSAVPSKYLFPIATSHSTRSRIYGTRGIIMWKFLIFIHLFLDVFYFFIDKRYQLPYYMGMIIIPVYNYHAIHLVHSCTKRRRFYEEIKQSSKHSSRYCNGSFHGRLRLRGKCIVRYL